MLRLALHRTLLWGYFSAYILSYGHNSLLYSAAKLLNEISVELYKKMKDVKTRAWNRGNAKSSLKIFILIQFSLILVYSFTKNFPRNEIGLLL